MTLPDIILPSLLSWFPWYHFVLIPQLHFLSLYFFCLSLKYLCLPSTISFSIHYQGHFIYSQEFNTLTEISDFKSSLKQYLWFHISKLLLSTPIWQMTDSQICLKPKPHSLINLLFSTHYHHHRNSPFLFPSSQSFNRWEETFTFIFMNKLHFNIKIKEFAK